MRGTREGALSCLVWGWWQQPSMTVLPGFSPLAVPKTTQQSKLKFLSKRTGLYNNWSPGGSKGPKRNKVEQPFSL